MNEPTVETTALINVKPELDTGFISLKTEIDNVCKFALLRTVHNQEEARSATNDLKIMSGLKKSLETERKKYVVPPQDFVKAINDVFKQLSDPLNDADRLTRTLIKEYMDEQDRVREEAEELTRRTQDLASKLGEMAEEGKETPEVEVTAIDIPDEQKHIRADIGTVGKAKIRKWKVDDFARVPDEYKMPDSSKIGKVVRAGIPSIPGIRIWEENSVRIS